MTLLKITSLAISTALLASCFFGPEPYKEDYTDWPTIQSPIPIHPRTERKISKILAGMTLEEKIGQMIQPEINSATPQDVIDYHLGSVLNGGGSWPDGNKYASAADWLALADSYWLASMDDSDGHQAIPLIWGTDAVHGHSNVYGATLFPHNIGLGAANDPMMLRHIGEATAKQVTVTGLDWTFAPTLAVVRDDRWGRTYEGYSEDPEIVYYYGYEMVRGLQGFFSESNVVATAKHFIGDGGTDKGDDQGDTLVTELDMINIHGQGYYSSLQAGVQTVMASFNSWNGEKLHGHSYLMNDVLKVKMGFDGFIVSDWNGIGQVEGCTNDRCAQAINAGIDMIMVPNDWKAFIANTIADVNSGAISMERIDDAVRRILRVKFRSGLFEKPQPSERIDAGDDSQLATDEMRALAREAVQKSLVLLKNEANVLPLSKSANILVVGSSADSMQNQTGGWTLTWQGTGNSNDEFPNGETIYSGFTKAVEAGVGSVTLNENGSLVDDSYDVIVAVIGESPYAEGNGDIGKFSTLDFKRQNPSGAQLLASLATSAPNTPVVTVFVGGRPLWMNPQLNQSDAFVAAWLPGSEGAGVADVLFGDVPFTGRLSYSWPAEDCQTPLNVGDEQVPLFAFGYGLDTDDDGSLALLSEEASDIGCDAPDITQSGTTNVPLGIFMNGNNQGDYKLRIGGPTNWGGVDVDVATDPSTTELVGDISATTENGSVQYSAMRIDWQGNGQVYSQLTDPNVGTDLAPYANSETNIRFSVKVNSSPVNDPVNLSLHCVYPCRGEVNIGPMLSALTLDQWHVIDIPLQCLINDGLDITNVNTPFLIWADDAALDISLEEISWQPFTAGEFPDCSAFEPDAAPQVTESTDVYIDGIADARFNPMGKWTANIDWGWAWADYFVTVSEIDEGAGDMAMDVQYGDGTNPDDGNSYSHVGNVSFTSVGALDLRPLTKLQFDVKVLSYGDAAAIVGKMVCEGDPNNCNTGDIDFSPSALDVWETKEIVFADYPSMKFENVTTLLEIGGDWYSWPPAHNNIHFQIDNVKLIK